MGPRVYVTLRRLARTPVCAERFPTLTSPLLRGGPPVGGEGDSYCYSLARGSWVIRGWGGVGVNRNGTHILNLRGGTPGCGEEGLLQRPPHCGGPSVEVTTRRYPLPGVGACALGLGAPSGYAVGSPAPSPPPATLMKAWAGRPQPRFRASLPCWASARGPPYPPQRRLFGDPLPQLVPGRDWGLPWVGVP